MKVINKNNADKLSATKSQITNATISRVIGNTIFQDHQPSIFTETFEFSDGFDVTLTPLQMIKGKLLHTTNIVNEFTLPTGVIMDAAFDNLITGSSFFMVITNTGGQRVSLGVAIGFTVTGAIAAPQTVDGNTSGFYWVCRLGAESWTALRVATVN